LKRLQLDYIDVLQCHRWVSDLRLTPAVDRAGQLTGRFDYDTPIEETVSLVLTPRISLYLISDASAP
jgi:aryl-alcohol dehydrogenase-like predicted oxidoreductase